MSPNSAVHERMCAVLELRADMELTVTFHNGDEVSGTFLDLVMGSVFPIALKIDSLAWPMTIPWDAIRSYRGAPPWAPKN